MAKTSKIREISCTSVFIFIIASAISAYIGFLAGLHHGEHLVPNNQFNIHNFHDHTLQADQINSNVDNNKVQRIETEHEIISSNTKCLEAAPCPVCEKAVKQPIEPILCPEPIKCAACIACPACPSKTDCPKTPIASSKTVTAGTKWTSVEIVNSYAIHELLIPNFPPRKDNNPKKALLLTHGAPRPEYQHGIIGNDKSNNASDSTTLQKTSFNFDDLTSTLEERDQVSKDLSSCDEVNIVIAKGDGRVCLAVMESYDAPPYHVFRLRRKDQGWVHAARYENNAGHMPSVPENLDGPSMRKMDTNASALLNNFMANRPRIDVELRPLLEKMSKNYGTKRRGPIVVLAVNAGVLDLVLNFVCSIRRLQAGGVGEHGDILKSVLVFAADEEVEIALKQQGVATYRHQALGSFPTASASGYGDDVFTSMMWLKVVSVYTVLRLGYDVLFQDADVIWWRDPRPYFTDITNDGQKYDAYFQNDGARSQRYSPFSANTGFYYLRSTAKSRFLMHDLLHQYNLISQWHSHQHVLCQLLVEHYTKTGLNVQILPHRFFSIGQQYHRKKDFMDHLMTNTLDPYPYMFHWSWTAGKSEKLKYSLETGMWYLKSQCNEKAIRSHKDDAEYLESCCMMPTGQENEHPYLFDKPLLPVPVE